MSGFFLITMPRAGGTALARLLGAVSSDCAAGLITAARELGPEAAREVLGGRGWRSVFYGRGDWKEAVGCWSWVLKTFPGVPLIFLTRDESAAYEISLDLTHETWIPAYGKCPGRVLMETRAHREAMVDFHVMNPGRTLMIDHSDLEDYDALAAKLGPLAASRETWEKLAAERPGSSRGMSPRPKVVSHAFEGWETHDWQADPFADDSGEESWEKIDWQADPFAGEEDAHVKRLRPELPGARRVPGTAAVYTLHYGASRWIGECGSSLDSWAARHGMDLHVWGEADPSYPHPKFCEVDMLRHFLAGEADWMLFVDGDVFVHPSAPRFPFVEGVSIMEDLPFQGLPHPKWQAWCRKHFPGLDTSGWAYRNAGVWACDRESAKLILAQAEAPFISGCMEQHQFNVWLLQASRRGLRVNPLDEEWNMFASQVSPAWFHHLAGRGDKDKKLRILRENHLLPWAPAPFKETPSTGPRAICYLWHSGKAAWDELRYSLRSVRENFTDHPPIHLFADRQPEWLEPDSGVIFHHAAAYEEALAGALQAADEVALMNDDIYFLRPTRWHDLLTALTRGSDLLPRMEDHLSKRNRWFRSVGRATASLHHHGHEHVRDFSTHTPYLFERAKSLETIRRHGIWWKVPFENLYHNDHGTTHRPCGRDKTTRLPGSQKARFLNHGAAGPCESTAAELIERFSQPAPWERVKVEQS